MVREQTHEHGDVASWQAAGSAAGGPTELPTRTWWTALKRTGQELGKDNLFDWAAALTYYSVLSIFPAVIVLTAVLGLLGPAATPGGHQVNPPPSRSPARRCGHQS
ncbi:MAG: YhjD/YihY/BrkB family envelope integrity protein, partial [Pseudonocardiaceae bacterium]